MPLSARIDPYHKGEIHRIMRQSRYHRRRARTPVPFLFLTAVILLAVSALFFSRALGRAEAPAAGSAPPPAKEQGQSGEKKTTPSGVACTLTELGEDAMYEGDLVLVNNQVLYHFPDDQQLASIYENKTSSYYVRDMEVYLAPHALKALNGMLDAFQAQGGSKTVNVVAGYRTREFQQHLLDQSAQRNGASYAQRFVAQPGGSEHHTGLVVDFSLFYGDGSSEEYDGKGEYAWINEHCQDYGWVVRYDGAKEAFTGIGDEPWHFRYVGEPHAAAMTELGMCLEEYTDYLKGFPFSGEHLTVDCGSGTYEIWYTTGTKAYLPDELEYTVSGNNVDGVVVTCKVS